MVSGGVDAHDGFSIALCSQKVELKFAACDAEHYHSIIIISYLPELKMAKQTFDQLSDRTSHTWHGFLGVV